MLIQFWMNHWGHFELRQSFMILCDASQKHTALLRLSHANIMSRSMPMSKQEVILVCGPPPPPKSPRHYTDPDRPPAKCRAGCMSPTRRSEGGGSYVTFWEMATGESIRLMGKLWLLKSGNVRGEVWRSCPLPPLPSNSCSHNILFSYMQSRLWWQCFAPDPHRDGKLFSPLLPPLLSAIFSRTVSPPPPPCSTMLSESLDNVARRGFVLPIVLC